MNEEMNGADNSSSGILRACLINPVEYIQNDEPMSTELMFPATKEAVHAALKEIRVSSENIESLFVSVAESDISELVEYFEHIDDATIDEVNYLASMLQGMDDQETHIFLAMATAKDPEPGIAELINAAKNVGCYSFDVVTGNLITEKAFATFYAGKEDIPAEYRVLIVPENGDAKLYLSQIAGWIENKTGVPQQIINTHERSDIRYVDYDNADATNMTIIADADIEVNSISWSGEYGLGLNVNSESDKNGEKVHVILWTDSETQKDERGYYMSAEGALNGVLVVSNPDTHITEEVIKEMLAVQDSRESVKKQDILTVKIYNAKLYQESGYKEFASVPLSFPATQEAVQAALKEIGVNGINYSRYLVDERSSDIKGLEDCIPENADIDELNYLASLIKYMDAQEIDILGALIDKNSRNYSIAEIINDIYNIPSYDIQPAYNAEEYGEFLLNLVFEEIGTLAEEAIDDSEAYGKIMSRFDEIEQYVDAKAYGQRIAEMEEGSFTDFGYLTKVNDVTESYRGKEDIPEKYRVFAYPDSEYKAGLYRIENTDITDFAYKLHILPGDFTKDLNTNMPVLSNGISDNYVLIMNRNELRITDAESAYQDHSEINGYLQAFPHDARAYLFHIEKMEDGRAFGSIVMVDCGLLSEDIKNNSISFTGITADIKGSISQYLSREQYDNLQHIDHDKIQGWHHHFEPSDVEKLTAHRGEFFNQRLKEAEAITPDTLIDYLNAEYMAEANYSQPGMIRIPLETAKTMLLNEDAPVFRLTPRSAEKLSMIAAATNALYTQNFREFAVKKEDRAGIDSMCRRETDKLAGKPPELDNHKKRDKPEQDL